MDSDQLRNPFDQMLEVFTDGVPQKRVHLLVKKPSEFLALFILSQLFSFYQMAAKSHGSVHYNPFQRGGLSSSCQIFLMRVLE